MTRRLDLTTLDALRGLAALYVVLHHTRWLLWSGVEAFRADATGVSRIFGMFPGLLRFGIPPVMLFFLISGFCIHYRQAKRLNQSREARSIGEVMEVRSYGFRRLRRLYPPFLFAIVLTAGLDAIGRQINPAYYQGQSAYDAINGYLFGGGDHLAIGTLIGNLLMQSNLSVPTFGSDVALWSLGIEAWFYVLYPALLWFSLRTGARGMLLSVAAFSLGAYGLSHLTQSVVPDWALRVLSYWVIWAVGAAVAEAAAARWAPRWPVLLLPAGAVLLGVALFHELTGRLGLDLLALSYTWAAGLAMLFAWVLLAAPARVCGLLEGGARRIRFLGDISYSLYLVHVPWLAFLSAVWLATHALLPEGAELALPGALSAVALASVSWLIAEKRFTTPRSARESSAATPAAAPAVEPAHPVGAAANELLLT
jgi:peptidoglycan/LPS O-acetylase OafA/YrhL